MSSWLEPRAWRDAPSIINGAQLSPVWDKCLMWRSPGKYGCVESVRLHSGAVYLLRNGLVNDRVNTSGLHSEWLICLEKPALKVNFWASKWLIVLMNSEPSDLIRANLKSCSLIPIIFEMCATCRCALERGCARPLSSTLNDRHRHKQS